MNLPPIIRIIVEPLRTWRYWISVATLFILGLLLSQLPAGTRNSICDFWDDYCKPHVTKAIEQSLCPKLRCPPGPSDEETPTTAPETRTVEHASMMAGAPTAELCAQLLALLQSFWDGIRPQEVAVDWRRSLFATAGFALVLSWALMLFLPASDSKVAITREVVGEAPTPPAETTERLLEYSLRARALRIAVWYALVSGFATTMLRPDFSVLSNDGISFRSWGHMIGIMAAAVACAIAGVHGFSDPRIPAARVAMYAAAKGVFLGSFIAISISLPYQLLRPPELYPIGERLVLTILAFRLVLLPALCGLAAYFAIGVYRRLAR